MTADRICDICGGRSVERLYDVNGYPIVRCTACGLVYVGRMPETEELVRLYGESYWEDADEEGYAGYAAAEARKRHHYRILLDELENGRSPGDVLEIGSAYGYFLDEARQRGWRVRGIEPSRHARDRARDQLGLEFAPGPLSDLPPDPASQDAIVLWDVIEHLPDPRRTLEVAHDWLRPGGLLALSTGNVGSMAARLHGRDWSLMTPPWHQFYFSRRTLRRLLESIGFRIEHVRGDGVVAADPASSNPRVPRPVARVLLSRPLTAVARRLGAGMIMFVFARKGAG